MSYNLKNKNVVIIAFVFAVMMTTGRLAYTEDNVPPSGDESAIVDPAGSDDIFGLDDEITAPAAEEQPTAKEVSDDSAENSTDENPEIPTEVKENPENGDVVNGENNTDKTAEKDNTAEDDIFADDEADDFDDSGLTDEEGNAENAEAPKSEEADGKEEDKTEDNIEAAEAPKSPFESFGNTILARVDNDLFNQMSSIEKQTTLLNLELKREEVRDRIEALKEKRAQAKAERLARKKEEERKEQEEALRRKKELLSEEQKLKEQEIRLEKVRQEKVLNEYRNEMLEISQKWIAKNTELLSKIKTMEDERKALAKDFENKLSALKREAEASKRRAQSAVASVQRKIESLNALVEDLKTSLAVSEDRYRAAKANKDGQNPFATQDELGQDAVDMSQEYAIMDITGKGKDIVAKIVSKDGTTFIIHPGSMLKGGEVVTSITDNYVAFDNKGLKSYLYTGGTVMKYEPQVTFNGSDKTPEVTEKQIIKPDTRNVLGAASTNTDSSENSSDKQETKNKNDKQTKSRKSTSNSNNTQKGGGVVSFGQGMFVK
jgi:hypothetical protein